MSYEEPKKNSTRYAFPRKQARHRLKENEIEINKDYTIENLKEEIRIEKRTKSDEL